MKTIVGFSWNCDSKHRTQFEKQLLHISDTTLIETINPISNFRDLVCVGKNDKISSCKIK